MKLISALFAQASADALSGPGFWTFAVTVATSAAAGVASVWGWFRSELKKCQDDREILFKSTETLRTQNTDLEVRLARVETTLKLIEQQKAVRT
jgi:hypothetical protein